MFGGRGRRRGRPPKATGFDNFRYLKNNSTKPRYLTALDSRENEFSPYSRAYSPSYSDSTRKSQKKRKSKGKRVSKKGSSNSRGYYTGYVEDGDSEYHYGSDFEDDYSERSDIEDVLTDSEDQDEIDKENFTDSEESVSSYSTVGGANRKSLYCHRNPIPEPIWLQGKEFPELQLPKSSEDLLVPREYAMRAVTVYEVLRRFGTLIRLSPFRFEDFCAAIINEENSYLLTEIHMMLLKAILREEDVQQTHFGALDQKDSVNSVLYFIDAVTWPEVLRSYVDSDKRFDSRVLAVLSATEYPFTDVENRLKVLEYLTDQFLVTSPVRERFLAEIPFHYEDQCRVCYKSGDLLCCETCPAVFHLDCLDPPLQNVPRDDWQCNVCKLHKVTGVTDCISQIEKSGLLIRQEPLGYDRHGRKYWFLCRRIFVENEYGECWYYSSPVQLDELLHALDSQEYEMLLCREINEFKDEIIRQMEITEKLTNLIKGSKKSYLEVENSRLLKVQQRRRENEGRLKEEYADDERHRTNLETTENDFTEAERKEDITDNTDEALMDGTISDDESEGSTENEDNDDGDDDFEDNSNDGSQKNQRKRRKKVEQCDIVTRSKTGSLQPRTFNIEELKKKTQNRFEQEKSVESESLESMALSEMNGNKMTRLKAQQIQTGTFLFKLGMDNMFKSYVNQYSSNPLALNKAQKQEEKDKKRHMSYKFSMTTASEFKWPGVIFGARQQLVHSLRQAFLQLESAIPVAFMHVNWPQIRKAWMAAVSGSSAPRDFARAIVALQACIKPSVFASVWHDQLGHVRLERITAAEREDKKRLDKKEKKEREDEEERNKLYSSVKYTLGLKHQVFKQKGEEYRLHGQWGWLWVSATRKYKFIDSRELGLNAGPNKYAVQVKDDNGVRVLMLDQRSYEVLKKCSDLIGDHNDNDDDDETKQQGLFKGDSDITSESLFPNLRHLKIIPPALSFNDLDVSKSLLSHGRLYFPKIAKKSKLDDLLPGRIHLKVYEERVNATKKAALEKAAALSKPPPPDKTSEEALNAVGLKIHEFRERYNLLSNIKHLYSCYSRSCNMGRSSTCYSPMCRERLHLRDRLLELLQKATDINKEIKIINVKAPATPVPSKMSAPVTNRSGGPEKQEPKAEQLSEAKTPSVLTKIPEKSEEQAASTEAVGDSGYSSSQSANVGNATKSSKLEEIASDSGVEIGERESDTDVKKSDTEKSGDSATMEIAGKTEIESVKERSVEQRQDIIGQPDVPFIFPDMCNEVEVGMTEEVCDINAGKEDETQKISATPSTVKEAKSITTVVADTAITKTTHTLSSKGKSAFYARRLKRLSEAQQDTPHLGRTKTVSVTSTKMMTSEVAKTEIPNMYSNPDTRQIVKMKRLPSMLNGSRKKKQQVKYPQSSTFTTRSRKLSLLVLPPHELKKLARQGGKSLVSGFHPAAKPNYSVWKYPCSRPLFRTCWLYRTVNLHTISAAGLQFRIVWACLRWDDLQFKGTYENKNQVSTDTEIITKEILEKRQLGAFMERTEYLIRKIVVPLECQKTVREVTPFRSGLRKRKREEITEKAQPKITEEWVDESKLELWEIRQFGEKLEREATAAHVQSMLRPRPLASAVANKYEALVNKVNEESKDKIDLTKHRNNLPIKKVQVNENSPIIKSILQTSGIEQKKFIPDGTPGLKQVSRLVSIGGDNGRQQVFRKIVMSGNTPSPNVVVSNANIANSTLANIASAGNSTQNTPDKSLTPGIRRIFVTRGPDGRTRMITQPMINTTRMSHSIPGAKASPSFTVTPRTSVSTESPTNANIATLKDRKLQIVKAPDGTVQVKGLLPGQQLVQLRDGSVQVFSRSPVSRTTANQQASPLMVQKVTSSTGDLIQLANVVTVPSVSRGTNPPKYVTVSDQTPNVNLRPVTCTKIPNVPTQTVLVQQTSGGQCVLQAMPSSQQQQQQKQKPSLILTQSGQIIGPSSQISGQLVQTQITTQGTNQLMVNGTPVSSSNLIQFVNGKATLATINGHLLLRPATSSDVQLQTPVLSTGSTQTQPIISANTLQTLQPVKQTPPNGISGLSTDLGVSRLSTLLAPASAVTNQQPLNKIISPLTSNMTYAGRQYKYNQNRQKIMQMQMPAENVVNPETGLTPEQEQIFLEKEPPGTTIKCITAEVTSSGPQGPYISLNGLNCDNFTADQLNVIRQQVKRELLKKAQQNTNEEMLGPTRVYLAVQPQASDRTFNSIDNYVAQDDYLNLPKLDSTKVEKWINDITTSSTEQSDDFSLSSDYIKDSIELALKQPEKVTEISKELSQYTDYKTDFVRDERQKDLWNLENITPMRSPSELLNPIPDISSLKRELPDNDYDMGVPNKKQKSFEDFMENEKGIKKGELDIFTEQQKSYEDVQVERQLMLHAHKEQYKKNVTDGRVKVEDEAISEVKVEILDVEPSDIDPLDFAPPLKGFNEEEIEGISSPAGIVDPLFSLSAEDTCSTGYKPLTSIPAVMTPPTSIPAVMTPPTSIPAVMTPSTSMPMATPSMMYAATSVDAMKGQSAGQRTPDIATSAASVSTPVSAYSTPVWASRASTYSTPMYGSRTPLYHTSSRARRSGSGRHQVGRSPRNRRRTAAATEARRAARQTREYDYEDDDIDVTRIKKEKLLCICRTPYDETKFYVGCDLCNNWFHGDCVGITQEMTNTLTEYICAECTEAKDTKKLYCFCQQSYDESQFYIGCDKCGGWFHGRCVGILQSEAEDIDEYLCPSCQYNSSINSANLRKLTTREFDDLKRLIREIKAHRNAWPFLKPVDPVEAPDYYKVVKQPMDLGKIERKINDRRYEKLSDFIGDMTQMFANCRYYNAIDSPFVRCAESLESFFADKIKRFRNKVNG